MGARNRGNRTRPLLDSRALRLLPIALASSAMILMIPAIALARAGGGEGFSGGGDSGGGGSGGGGGGGYLIYLLIRLCFDYPVIGVPVVIIVVVVAIAGSRQGSTVYQSSVIRRGGDLIDQQSKNAVITAITQHDPQFDESAFCKRVADAFAKVQQAWTAQDLNAVRPFISDGVHERFSLEFIEQRDAGYRDALEGLAIDDIRLADISSAGVFDEVAVRIAAHAADYRIAMSDGHRISGSTQIEPFVEIWSFLRKRSAVTDLSRPGLMEGHCPNCGAAIQMNESANCSNCKALLRSGQYDWVLSEITQESEWSASSNRPIPGLEALQQQDAGFDPLALEDRASVVFWRRAAADRTGKIDPLRKIASDQFASTCAQSLHAANGQPRRFVGECAVGGVHMFGFLPAGADSLLERTLVDIRWSGTQFITTPDGRTNRPGEHIVSRNLMVLGRNAGSQTDTANGISSAHCPNCGAPDSSDASNACPFCNTVLNDGAHGWILLDMLGFSTPGAQILLDALNGSQPMTNHTPYSGSDAGLVAWAVDVAATDRNVDDNERRILSNFADQCGVSSDQLDRMINAAIRGQLEVPQPADPNQARTWLKAMAATAQAGGTITPDTITLFRTLGNKVGLGDYDIKALLRQARAEQYATASAALRSAKNST